MFDLTFAKPSLATLTAAIGLALLSGCTSASEPRPVTSHRPAAHHAATAVQTTSRAPVPPGSIQFSFDDSRVRSFAAEAPRTQLRPGHTVRPRHLGVH